MKSALLICAHPDDAELMVGGTIALLTDRGFRVSVALFTTSAQVPLDAPRRKRAAQEAAAVLGHEIVWVEEDRFDHVIDMPEPLCVSLIDRLLRERRPELVFSHGTYDSHCDHAQIGRCVIAATRHSDAQFFAFGPSEYRAAANHSFVPNVFVDVSPYMAKKRAAIDCYNYEGAPYRELRSGEIAALNKADGLRCGAEYAETLRVIRQFGIPVDRVGAPLRAVGIQEPI